MKHTRHIAVYVRVSTRSQDTRSQEPDLRRWAEAQDLPVVWYKDKFTGKSMDRPGFQKMTRAIEAGEVVSVVVWRLDRLGRTAKGLTGFFDDLVVRAVNLISMKDGLDLSTPAGRLMANVLASVASYETEVRSERIHAGIAVAQAQGKHMGRKPGIHTRIKVKPEQIRLVRELAARGEGKTAIAAATGLSRPTIYSILREAEAATA
jgi:DNA invertase Pin-like site-specific DNA recombinase